MPYQKKKRAYNKKAVKTYRKYGGKARVLPAVRTIQAAVRRQLAKVVETKRANQTTADGIEIFHNNFTTLNSIMLFTTPGPFDPTTNASDCRIGDEVNLKGLSMKMMIELNERYSDVTFRLLVVKCAKGDVPTRATLFNGLSGNKMIDTLNTERYTVIFQKYFKMTAPNSTASTATGTSTQAGTTIPPLSTGIYYGPGISGSILSRATKIIKVWIPGTKFVRSGVLRYEQGSSQPKFFDYHCLLYSYSNYSTDQDIVYVARVNDYIQQIFYKDA